MVFSWWNQNKTDKSGASFSCHATNAKQQPEDVRSCGLCSNNDCGAQTASRKIQPAVSALPETSSLTVGEKRGPPLTVRRSKPAASHWPWDEKLANPWEGNDGLFLRRLPHRKIYSIGEHWPREVPLKAVFINLTRKTQSNQNKDMLWKYLQTLYPSVSITFSQCQFRVCIPF